MDISKLRSPSFPVGQIGSFGKISLYRTTYLSFSRIAQLDRRETLSTQDLVSNIIHQLAIKPDETLFSLNEIRDLKVQDRSRIVSKLIDLHPSWFGLNSDTDDASSEQAPLERSDSESDEDYLARAFRAEAWRLTERGNGGVLGIAAGLSANRSASAGVADLIKAMSDPLRFPHTPSNPIHDTNDILSGVASQIRQMRELATATAQMQRTLNDTASAAVADFNTGAIASQRATANGLLVAKASLLVSVIALGVTMYFSINQNSATSAREKAAAQQVADLISSEKAAQNRTAQLIASERALAETVAGLSKELTLARQTQPVGQTSTRTEKANRH